MCQCAMLSAVFGVPAIRVSPGLVVVGALVLLVPFLPATSTFFISDDFGMVLFGATTGAGEIDWLPSSRWSWHRPLPAFTWVLTHAVAGDRLVWWHAPNLLIHGISTALAASLAYRFSASHATAALTAILFAWSPVTVGTVTWISARPDLLATCFVLATLVVAYSPRAARRPVAQAAALGGLVLLAISSKESAFALLPLSMALYVAPRWLPVDARWRAPLALPVIAGVLMTGFLGARLLLYGSTLGGYGVPLSARRLLSAPLMAAAACTSIVRLVGGVGAQGWALLAVGASASLALLRIAPIWTIGALCSVLPAAHLIAAALPVWEYDRFYYLASFWIAGGLATGVVALANRGWRRVAVAVAVALVGSSLVNLAQRLDGLREASAVTRRLDTTLRQARGTLPPGSVILCAGLPDNVRGAYAYRNGCLDHVTLVWPNREVTAVAHEQDVPAGAPLFAIAPDGGAIVGRNKGTKELRNEGAKARRKEGT